MKQRRGFTLIELMIGIVIGAFSVLVAAHVATVVVQHAAKGRQATDFNSRARLIGRQLRTDVRLTGVGSTGAVTADPNNQPWATLFAAQTSGGVTPDGGFRAFPAVSAANNVAPVGGIPILEGSDAVMMTVVNPLAHARTFQTSPAPGSNLVLEPTADLTAFNGCTMVYIVDHSTPSGAGRTQIANLGSLAGNVLSIAPDTLQFTVQANSDVLCARVSTYWASDTDGDRVGNNLMRSDLVFGSTPIIVGAGASRVVIQPGGNDVIAPGILDFQVAVAFSAEVYRRAGQPPDPTRVWAFVPAGQELVLTDSFDWFEARMVRFNIHARRMRAIDNIQNTSNVARAEDAPAFPGPLPTATQPELLTTAETLVNLRYYDFGTPAGVAAEPY